MIKRITYDDDNNNSYYSSSDRTKKKDSNTIISSNTLSKTESLTCRLDKILIKK